MAFSQWNWPFNCVCVTLSRSKSANPCICGPKMKFTENIYVNDKIIDMQFYIVIDVIQRPTSRQKTDPVYMLFKKRTSDY